jgi:hypothetical protein
LIELLVVIAINWGVTNVIPARLSVPAGN